MVHIMAKEIIERIVTVNTAYEYVSRFSGEYNTFYCFEDEDGILYAYNCSSTLRAWHADDNSYEDIAKGDKVHISGTFKSVGEYKGKQQIKITRVQVIHRLQRAARWEEIREMRRLDREAEAQEQRNSVKATDKIERMSYKKYKTKFADCETIKNSYDEYSRTIEVIIRNYELRK